MFPHVLLSPCSPEVSSCHVARDVEEDKTLQSLWEFHWFSITLQLDPALQVALAVREELLPAQNAIQHHVLSATPAIIKLLDQ